MSDLESLTETYAHYFLVPVAPDSKVSRTYWNQTEFSLAQIVYHVRRGGNVAVKAGATKTGPFVLAVDRDARNLESWRFLQKYRLYRSNMQTETASGNWHLWFALDEWIDDLRTKIKFLGLPIDIKATGYVLFPPSKIGERTYHFRDGKGFKKPEELVRLPPAFLELLREKPRPPRAAVAAVASLPRYSSAALRYEANRVQNAKEGNRNATLNRAAFSLGGLVATGLLTREVVEAALFEAALACGLGEKEIAATLKSGMEAGLKHPRNRRPY